MESELGQEIIDSVEKHGWYVVNVVPRPDGSDGEERYSYTVGLTKSMQWPEMICFGLAADETGEMLRLTVAECWERQVVPHDGMMLDQVLDGATAKLARNDRIPDNYLGLADWYAAEVNLPAPERLQLMWPDRNHLFPDDERCLPEVRAAQTPYHAV